MEVYSLTLIASCVLESFYFVITSLAGHLYMEVSFLMRDTLRMTSYEDCSPALPKIPAKIISVTASEDVKMPTAMGVCLKERIYVVRARCLQMTAFHFKGISLMVEEIFSTVKNCLVAVLSFRQFCPKRVLSYAKSCPAVACGLFWFLLGSVVVQETVAVNAGTGPHKLLVFQYWALTPDQSVYHLPVKNPCVCRSKCFVYPSCVAWSTRVREGELMCHLADQGPVNIAPNHIPADETASYGYTLQSLPSPRLRGSDNLYYFFGQQNKKFDDARQYCSSVPGFRLAMFKTQEQLKALATLRDMMPHWGIFVDLVKMDSGPVTWGDGTLYVNHQQLFVIDNISGHPKVFYINRSWGRRFSAYDITNAVPPLCQGNYHGINW